MASENVNFAKVAYKIGMVDYFTLIKLLRGFQKSDLAEKQGQFYRIAS